jgi:hypothetical protein
VLALVDFLAQASPSEQQLGGGSCHRRQWQGRNADARTEAYEHVAEIAAEVGVQLASVDAPQTVVSLVETDEGPACGSRSSTEGTSDACVS